MRAQTTVDTWYFKEVLFEKATSNFNPRHKEQGGNNIMDITCVT